MGGAQNLAQRQKSLQVYPANTFETAFHFQYSLIIDPLPRTATIERKSLKLIRAKINVLLQIAKFVHANNWGEPERAPHDQSNGDRVCLSVCLSICPTYVHIPYICVF